MGLSTNELERVALELEQNGATLKRTRKGYIVWGPLGSCAFHLTPSDGNQARQLARDLRRCGLEIPAALPLGKRK